jgi:hypothetical protein
MVCHRLWIIFGGFIHPHPIYSCCYYYRVFSFLRFLSSAFSFSDAWVRGISELPITLSGHAAITLPPAMLISSE